ncbi:MAG: carboxypeptidase-like regulatory domain-containing protein [Vicinamibacterales bacterium]|nr:carboxypeptidase-like regulatory domain-containing protein [Vicinamibacterales bacterium]
MLRTTSRTRVALLVCAISLAVTESPSQTPDTAIVAEWAAYMTPDELAIFDAVSRAAAEEGVTVLTLPVGSWGRRIQDRLAEALRLRAINPSLTTGQVNDLLRTDDTLYAGPGSDYDLTIALKDVPDRGLIARERQVVERINSRVRAHFDTPDGQRSHLVRTMSEHVWDDQKFSGEGGKFFALKSTPFALEAAPNAPIGRLPREAYYSLRNAPVPNALTHPTLWLDDAVGIIASGTVSQGTGLTEDVAKTRAAIKYWRKFKQFFEGELAGTLPPDLRRGLAERLGGIPPDVEDLLRLDNDSLVRRLQAMESVVLEQGAGGRPVKTALSQLFDRTFDDMRRYRDKVEVYDLIRRGRLAPTVEAVSETLSRWDGIRRVLARMGGRALGAAAGVLSVPAMYGALEKYATGDSIGFARDLAGLLADVATPGAGLAAELADLGRALAAEGLITAADAVFFDPLNQEVLTAYYETESEEYGVFTMEGSPFAGLRRETLYARYRMSPEEARQALARDARLFVGMLPKGERLVGHTATSFWDLISRLGFLTTGAGSLADALTVALMGDWERSRLQVDAILALGDQLQFPGYFVPELPPVSVVVDGDTVTAGEVGAVTMTLAPGESRTVTVDVVRRYGRRFGIPGLLKKSTGGVENRQSYFETVGKVRGGVTARLLEVFERGFEVGTAPAAPGLPAGKPVRVFGRTAVDRWVEASTGLFEVAPLDVSHLSARECPGWRVEGPWTPGEGWQQTLSLPYPNENGEGTINARTARVHIVVTAPAPDSEPCTVDETLVVSWRAPIGDASLRHTVHVRARLAPVPSTAFEVTGTVTNRETGVVLPGARVVLTGTRTYTTIAGPDGTVVFSAIPAGEYEIAIGYPGFETRRTTLAVNRHLRNGTFALTPTTTAQERPRPVPSDTVAAPTTPERVAPSAPTSTEFTVSFGDSYVPKADKSDAGQRFTFTAPGPGTITVTYTYRPAKPSTVRYYGDESGYRAQARVEWSAAGQKPGRVNAGWLYRGTTQLPETTGTATFSVTAAGPVELRAYPEETPAYFYRNQWVDNWYDATHTHYHGATAVIRVAFTPAK